MTTFISLATSATMFPMDGFIKMEEIRPEDVQVAIEHGAISALNPSHAVTINAIQRKYGVKLPVPEKAPKVSLNAGDALIIVQANLPRLAEGEMHSDQTIESAQITFRKWTLLEP